MSWVDLLGALALLSVLGNGMACRYLPIQTQILEPSPELSFDRPADLLPPDRLRITSTRDRQISLAWDPVLIGDVAGYAIMRADAAGGPYRPAGTTRSRFATVFTDNGGSPGALTDGRTYFYRIHPFDTQGRVSRSHAYRMATTDPVPEAPTALRAYSNQPRRVVLEWEPSRNLSVTRYAVYRSPTEAGPWERIAVIEGRLQTIHLDPVPGDLRVMYYRVRALNRFNGESRMTDPIRAVTKAEPLPPVDLALVQRALGQARFRWAPNVEEDIAHYEVWRSRADDSGWSEEVSLAQVPADTPVFTDAGVGCGERVRYRLRAVDSDDLISHFSKPLEVTGEAIELAAQGLQDGQVELHWDSARTAGWPIVRILERRVMWPDRLLGLAEPGQNRIHVQAAPGPHSYAVVLTRDAAVPSDATAVPSARPASLSCLIRVEVPAHPSAPPDGERLESEPGSD